MSVKMGNQKSVSDGKAGRAKKVGVLAVAAFAALFFRAPMVGAQAGNGGRADGERVKVQAFVSVLEKCGEQASKKEGYANEFGTCLLDEAKTSKGKQLILGFASQVDGLADEEVKVQVEGGKALFKKCDEAAGKNENYGEEFSACINNEALKALNESARADVAQAIALMDACEENAGKEETPGKAKDFKEAYVGCVSRLAALLDSWFAKVAAGILNELEGLPAGQFKLAAKKFKATVNACFSKASEEEFFQEFISCMEEKLGEPEKEFEI